MRSYYTPDRPLIKLFWTGITGHPPPKIPGWKHIDHNFQNFDPDYLGSGWLLLPDHTSLTVSHWNNVDRFISYCNARNLSYEIHDCTNPMEDTYQWAVL